MATDQKKNDAITGIQAMQGHGVQESKGFWADAWSQVLKRPGAIFGITWIAIVGFFAVFSPLLANGHPLVMWTLNEDGTKKRSMPLFEHLSAADWLLLLGTTIGVLWTIMPAKDSRWPRVGNMVWAGTQATLISVSMLVIGGVFGRRDAPDWVRDLEQWSLQIGEREIGFEWFAAALVALVWSIVFMILPAIASLQRRAVITLLTGLIAWIVAASTWSQPPQNWQYRDMIRSGDAEAIFTLVPWSPQQIMGDRGAQLLPPGASSETPLARSIAIDTGVLNFTRSMTKREVAGVEKLINRQPLSDDEKNELTEAWRELVASSPDGVTRAMLEERFENILIGYGHRFYLGTDSKGQDVMSQMLHASRLAISIGLVSTGIATLIGVTVGALMGYFGGFIDLMLYRIVEVFMAVPVLFLLIVAAGVLPPEARSTYVMMAIIGVFTWHGAARFTRAEFLKLRNQDFVQSARAVGLPLPSILFRHMLPNGVAPVLVDASFLIAGAILFETILSYLGLGPPDQASWGQLLADATSDSGDFKWWLAFFPGMVIFLTVLAYNLIGESFQMAIDPKLRKARV